MLTGERMKNISKRELSRMRHDIIRSRNLIAMHEATLNTVEEIINRRGGGKNAVRRR